MRNWLISFSRWEEVCEVCEGEGEGEVGFGDSEGEAEGEGQGDVVF